MRVLMANLKHLYQRQDFWTVYTFIGLLLWPLSGSDSQDAHASLWLLAVLTGAVVGGISRGVINKPFARCLPGHWTAVRRTTFLVASAVGIVVGILFMRNAGIGIWRSPVVFCAAASVGMTFCLLMGALLLTPWKMKSPAAGILFCLAGVMIAMVAGSRVLYVPGWMVLKYPLSVVVGGVTIGAVLWVRMGRREWERRLFSLALCFGASAERRKLYGGLERRFARGARASAVTESLLLGWMEACPNGSAARYVWGTLYVAFGVVAPWWKCLAVAFAILALMAGYMGEMAVVIFILISWLVSGFPSWPPLHSTILVPAGRRERLLASMTLGVATAGILIVWVVVAVVVSTSLSRLIPEIELWNTPFAYSQVSIANVCVPLIVVPFHAALRVLYPWRRWYEIDIIYPIAVLLLIVICALLLALSVFFLHGAIPHVETPTWIAAGVVFAWMFLLGACKYRTRYGALAGQ